MISRKVWFYGPQVTWPKAGHGSDEWSRCTFYVTVPFVGTLVVVRRTQGCYRHDRKAAMAYVSVPRQDPAEVSIKTIQVHPQVSLDVTVDSGQLVGIEIHLPAQFDPWPDDEDVTP